MSAAASPLAAPATPPSVGAALVSLPVLHGVIEHAAAPDSDPVSAGALVPGEPRPPTSALGATTLRLVERSLETIRLLHGRVDAISAQARDLIRLTHRARADQQAELERARAEAEAWRRQAGDLELRLREAQLRAREAELGRREAEQAALDARRRTRAAEAEVEGLEADLRQIGDFLTANLGR